MRHATYSQIIKEKNECVCVHAYVSVCVCVFVETACVRVHDNQMR